MKLLHALTAKLPHKYAIDAARLGDERTLAWSNLGYWDNTTDYKTACCQLADQ
ncbi:SAM-dependent methyltransferase, partial [Salmonella enterica subsp. enterica]|nr:SAM-dependent methyltransferase [Salmonella enterica subsp. enterica serovar Paratyphi A]